MNLVEKAIHFASKAHAGQIDKSGMPLILHPLFVMSRMKCEKTRVIAMLHDILEDTNKTESDLRKEEFPEDIIEAVIILTRLKDEDYLDDYIKRVRANKLAVVVKISDLEHNMDLSRIQNPSAKDFKRLEKYKKAYALLRLEQRQSEIDDILVNTNLNACSEYALEEIIYRFSRSDYELFANVLSQILENASKTYAPKAIVQARAKKIDSFVEKCYRKDCKKQGRDPLSINKGGFTDLCGVRIIVHTLQQVEELSEFIRENFLIDIENSLDVSERLRLSEFGYRSIHYIVSLKPEVHRLLGIDTHLEFLLGKKAEIQIRTILQHSWADILHDRIYKSSVSPLTRHQRSIAQMAALMETGDKLYKKFIDDFDAYSLNIKVNMTIKEIENELIILQGMNENESHSFTKLQNTFKMVKYLRMLGHYDKICSLLDSFIENSDLDLDNIVKTNLFFEYGLALCKGKGEKAPSIYRTGFDYLQKALRNYEYLDNDCSHLWMRYKRFYIDMLLTVGECEHNPNIRKKYFEKVLGIDAVNPYALCELVKLDSINSTQLLSTIKAAIQIATDHLTSNINIPFVYFVLGRLNYAINRDIEGFDYYCQGFIFFANQPQSERKNIWIRDILFFESEYLSHNTQKATTRALFSIAQSLFTNLYEVNIENDKEKNNKDIFILAKSDLESLKSMCSALSLNKIYLDDTDEWMVIDTLATIAGNNNNDLFLYIDTEDYRAEIITQSALALGIYVICVNRNLVEKLSARSLPPRLYDVPNDYETLLWTILSPTTPLETDFILNTARTMHNVYVQSQANKLWNSAPDMMEWSKLGETYKNSNINKIRASIELLNQNGFKLEKNTQETVRYEDLTDTEKDNLAKAEHGRWIAEKVKDGWMFGKSDDNMKKNENIVAWDQLTETLKRSDYHAIETIFKVINQCGFNIVRK